MCGRYTLTLDRNAISVVYDAQWASQDAAASWQPRFNIAPESRLPVIVSEGGRRVIRSMKWGLVPHWAKDEASAARSINARAETVADKPTFRTAFRQHRALVPADSFYEWDPGRTPHRIVGSGGAPYAFAAVWDAWRAPGGEVLESFAIVTREATPSLAPIHHRMPVILEPEDYGFWLDPANKDLSGLKRMLLRVPSQSLTAYAVSKTVNSGRVDDPSCIKAASEVDPSALAAAGEALEKSRRAEDDDQLKFRW